uniref:ATP synthase complex subunit 8 n=1 Tax=Dorysthenes paradoxus TaxID=690276 RepID=A0A3P8MSF9_9CUCU|nr:ATP synthase F0 subunit 8 [Dorysthenes paradoxus]AWI69837.1 ATP synthase F0 subunit 8 [Dorysthenes paradoxus]
MPQMSPLNWLSLFMFFIAMFIVFNSMNYFSFTYPVKKLDTKKMKSKFNWKW